MGEAEMPIPPITPTLVPTSITERLARIVSGLGDYLDDALGQLRNAADEMVHPERLVERLSIILNKLLERFDEFTSARANTQSSPFITAAGQTPGPNQMTSSGFANAVAAAVAGGLPPGRVITPARVATAISKLFDLFAPALDAETYVRWILNLERNISASSAADGLARFITSDVVESLKASAASWPDDDTPQDDDEKEETEIASVAGAGLASWIEALIDQLPHQVPSSPAVGRAVHRTVMIAYADAHPDDLVVYDGRVRIDMTTGIQVSKIWTGSGQVAIGNLNDPDALPRLGDFYQAISSQKRRPDIADLDTKATGSDPAKDWGWFEIKPLGKVPVAVTEINGFYLDPWNAYVSTHGHPQYVSGLGTWLPPLIGMTWNPNTYYIALTIPPGVIGYLVYESEELALLEAAVVVSIVGALLAKISQMLKLLEEAGDLVEGYAQSVLTVLGMVAAVVVVAIALAPEEAGAALLAALAEAAAAAAALIDRIISIPLPN